MMPFYSKKGDVLSDNTQANYCDTCRDCSMWGLDKEDFFSNQHDKSSCAMYPYPGTKPGYVINNRAPCPFKVPKEEKA